MPISLRNTASVLPWLRYSPQADKMAVAGENNTPREIDYLNKLLAIDVENGSPGHLLIGEGQRDWKPYLLNSEPPSSPGPNYKRGFSVLVQAPKLFGSNEAFEMCASTGAHLSFVERLFNEAEPGFGQGNVPLVKITESEPIKVGKGKSRELHFEIVRWIPRPAAFTEALAKLKTAAAPSKDKRAADPGGDDFDDDTAAPKGKPKPDDGDDFGGAAASPEEEPKPKTGKAKKGRGKAQTEPPKHSSDILDDPIPFA